MNAALLGFPHSGTTPMHRILSELGVDIPELNSLPKDQERAVVIARHPVDTLHSLLKARGNGTSFDQFLTEPLGVMADFTRYPLEEWALYYALLSAIYAPRNLCHIAYEELVADPLTEVNKVLQFLGVEREESAVQWAIEAAHFKAEPAKQEISDQLAELLCGLPDRIAKRLLYPFDGIEKLSPIDMLSAPPMNALLNLQKDRLRVGAASWYYRALTERYGRAVADNAWGDLVYLCDTPINGIIAAQAYHSIRKTKRARRLLDWATSQATTFGTFTLIAKAEQRIGSFRRFLRAWRQTARLARCYAERSIVKQLRARDSGLRKIMRKWKKRFA
jgi:hypothetical protein